MARVVLWATWWLDDRLALLIPAWDYKCKTAISPLEKASACSLLGLLKTYRDQKPRRPKFDSSIFT